ncbi:MAG: hypothetical protein M3O36_00135, partial [Myxococcota bacterium]|nr:hypothetical protein [Myxococcota bacterium]
MTNVAADAVAGTTSRVRAADSRALDGQECSARNEAQSAPAASITGTGPAADLNVRRGGGSVLTIDRSCDDGFAAGGRCGGGSALTAARACVRRSAAVGAVT